MENRINHWDALGSDERLALCLQASEHDKQSDTYHRIRQVMQDRLHSLETWSSREGGQYLLPLAEALGSETLTRHAQRYARCYELMGRWRQLRPPEQVAALEAFGTPKHYNRNMFVQVAEWSVEASNLQRLFSCTREDRRALSKILRVLQNLGSQEARIKLQDMQITLVKGYLSHPTFSTHADVIDIAELLEANTLADRAREMRTLVSKWRTLDSAVRQGLLQEMKQTPRLYREALHDLLYMISQAPPIPCAESNLADWRSQICDLTELSAYDAHTVHPLLEWYRSDLLRKIREDPSLLSTLRDDIEILNLTDLLKPLLNPPEPEVKGLKKLLRIKPKGPSWATRSAYLELHIRELADLVPRPPPPPPSEAQPRLNPLHMQVTAHCDLSALTQMSLDRLLEILGEAASCGLLPAEYAVMNIDPKRASLAYPLADCLPKLFERLERLESNDKLREQESQLRTVLRCYTHVLHERLEACDDPAAREAVLLTMERRFLQEFVPAIYGCDSVQETSLHSLIMEELQTATATTEFSGLLVWLANKRDQMVTQMLTQLIQSTIVRENLAGRDVHSRVAKWRLRCADTWGLGPQAVPDPILSDHVTLREVQLRFKQMYTAQTIIEWVADEHALGDQAHPALKWKPIYAVLTDNYNLAHTGLDFVGADWKLTHSGLDAFLTAAGVLVPPRPEPVEASSTSSEDMALHDWDASAITFL